MTAGGALKERRKRLFLSLTLYGFRFERVLRSTREPAPEGTRITSGGVWHFIAPPHALARRRNNSGHVSGYYKWRHEAVDSAAKQFDLEL